MVSANFVLEFVKINVDMLFNYFKFYCKNNLKGGHI